MKASILKKINLQLTNIVHHFRTFVLKNPDRYQPKSPAKKEGFPGPITEEKGFVSYVEICQLVSDGTWTKRTDADSNAYVTKGSQWAGYDTPNSVRRKVIFFNVYYPCRSMHVSKCKSDLK